jgi:hypothetical protein
MQQAASCVALSRPVDLERSVGRGAYRIFSELAQQMAHRWSAPERPMRIVTFAPFVMLLVAGLACSSGVARSAAAVSAVEIDTQVDAALIRFYQQVPAGRDLAGKAKAILIFPSVIKAGFGAGGE